MSIEVLLEGSFNKQYVKYKNKIESYNLKFISNNIFGELKKSIGSVSQKVLTAQLRDMEENGLVNRKVYAEVPPRVEYSLTELGQSLKPILDAMWSWGEDYKEKCNK